MADRVEGIERIKNPPGMEDDVWVKDLGGNGWTMPESVYEARGHNPPLKSLPWRGKP